MDSQIPPEISCRIATEDEIPRNARSLVTLAGKHSWTAVCTYARGTLPGKTPKVVDSIAVRLRRDESPRLAGLWIDGRFDSASSSLMEPLTFTELRERVSAE